MGLIVSSSRRRREMVVPREFASKERRAAYLEAVTNALIDAGIMIRPVVSENNACRDVRVFSRDAITPPASPSCARVARV